jgi:hypothetical protein
MTTNNAQPLYRITDIRNITLNSEPRVCFTAYILEHDAYVHIGPFSAPADTPEDALYEHINMNDDEQNEEQS